MDVRSADLESRKPALAPAVLQGILQENAPRLLAYLDRHMPPGLRRLVEPQDVLQDVFFEAFVRIHEFQPHGDDAHHRWLVTIARHKILNLLRAQRAVKRGGRLQSANDSSRIIDMLEQLAVYTRTPSQSAISHEVAKAVQQSLNSLKPQYRQVLQCRYFDGLSIQQTSAFLHKTEGAVTMLCSRALNELKDLILSAERAR